MRSSKRRARSLTIVSVLMATALVLSGCAPNLDSSSGTVRTRFDADPASFDPAQLVGGDDYYVSRLLFDTLMRYDDDGQIVGGLAESWDFNALGGTIELAGGATCQDGTVIDAGPASGFGQWVRVKHDDGTITVYGHVATIDVTVGQHVTAGQKIAGMGNEGFSTGTHLHFEVHPGGGEAIDPVPWLAARNIFV